jgi:hypothetical protein
MGTLDRQNSDRCLQHEVTDRSIPSSVASLSNNLAIHRRLLAPGCACCWFTHIIQRCNRVSVTRVRHNGAAAAGSGLEGGLRNGSGVFVDRTCSPSFGLQGRSRLHGTFPN